MSFIAFIVTCKGRLHHLRSSLPRIAAQAGTECILVDYDCPDRTYAWVTENFPTVKVVRVDDAPHFNLARARNIGAAATTAEWLCFVDADVLLAANFVSTLSPMLQAGFYYRPMPIAAGAAGSHLCRRSDFLSIEGYDEAIEGWGAEDFDFYARLASLGCRQADFPGSLLDVIAHDDHERAQHYSIQNIWLNQRINRLYLQIKYDLLRHLGPLSLQVRRALYEEVRRALLQDAASGKNSHQFEVKLNDGLALPDMTIKRRLMYDLEPRNGAAP